MRFGTTSIGDPDITETIDREIDDYKVHPKYKHNEPYFDVGIAYTKTKVEYTPYIRPICLPMNPIGKKNNSSKICKGAILTWATGPWHRLFFCPPQKSGCILGCYYL